MQQVVIVYVAGGGKSVPITDAMLSDMASRYGGRFVGSSFALVDGGTAKVAIVDGVSLDSAPLSDGAPSDFSAAVTASAQSFPGLMVDAKEFSPVTPPPYTWTPPPA